MRKRSITRKLIMSITTAAMTAVCLGTTTYAWFSQNKNVWVEETDLYIDSYDGLLISLDGKNFSQDISSDVLKQYITNKETAEEARAAYKDLKLIGTSMQQDNDGNISRNDNGIMFGHDTIRHEENKYINTIKFYDQVSEEIIGYLVVETDNNEIISFKAFDKDDVELVVDDTNKATGRYIIKNDGGDTIADITNFTVNGYVRDNMVIKASESVNYGYIITYVDNGYSHNITESTVNNNYLKFDLYFRIVSDGELSNNHEDYDLKFTEDTYLESEELASALLVNDLVSGDTEYKAGDSIDFDIKNAMRIAVDSNDGLNIFEVNDDNDLGGVAIEGSNDPKHDKTKNAMYTYYNNIHPNYAFAEAAMDGKRFVTNDKFTDISLGKFKFDEESKKYNDLKTTVYVWLEGWDADYFLGAGLDSRKLNIRLDFKYKDEI